MRGDRCPLVPLGMTRCDRPAIYEMDIDRNEKWIPLCAEHGPMYRRSSNVRIRTLRTPVPDTWDEADYRRDGDQALAALADSITRHDGQEQGE